MALAADNVFKKSAFRCLDVVRYVVAAAVTMLIVAVIVYAVKVVHGPGDLTLSIVGGSVSVERQYGEPYVVNSSSSLYFSFTLRAVNPSSRVKIYFNGLFFRFSGRNSSSAMNVFFSNAAGDMNPVEHQSTTDKDMGGYAYVHWKTQEFYFQALANGSSIADASLKLNGTRLVESLYSGQNTTGVPAVYYCSPLTFGGGKDDAGKAAVDIPCTEDPPTTILVDDEDYDDYYLH